MPSTVEIVAFVSFLGAAILIFGGISFAMTANRGSARKWGCRIAAGFFVLVGVGFLTSGVTTQRAGYLWAVVMFAVAGWQWRLGSR